MIGQIIKAVKTSCIFSSRYISRLFSIRSRFYDLSPYIKSQLGRKRIETRKIRHLKNRIIAFDIKYPLSADELLSSALRGVAILHETYGLNLERFIRGELLDNKALLKSRKIDSLKNDDLALMAVEAFKMDCYDSSIKYIKASTYSYHQHRSEKNRSTYNFPKLEEVSLDTRRFYAKHHNMLLVQSKTTTDLLSEGIQWKLFPNVVDEGLNTNILYFIVNKHL